MQAVLKKLKQSGYHLTKPRQLILSVLTHQPQSVVEIVNLLQAQGTKIDTVTVYRTLECFAQLGVVGKTQFKDKTALFELIEVDGHHHHHLVCDHCGTIEDVDVNEHQLLGEVEKKTAFKIKSHTLEFFGLCTDCQ